MEKKLTIQVRVLDDEIATIVKRDVFKETASSTLEVIGILTNLISQERSKLETVLEIKK